MTRPDASTQAIFDTVKHLTVLAGRTQRQQEGVAGGNGFDVRIIVNTGADIQDVPVLDIKSKQTLEGEAVEESGS